MSEEEYFTNWKYHQDKLKKNVWVVHEPTDREITLENIVGKLIRGKELFKYEKELIENIIKNMEHIIPFEIDWNKFLEPAFKKLP